MTEPEIVSRAAIGTGWDEKELFMLSYAFADLTQYAAAGKFRKKRRQSSGNGERTGQHEVSATSP